VKSLPVRILLRLYLVFIFAYLFAPVVALILFSFQDAPIQSFPIESVSTRWYAAAWHNTDFRDGVLTSVGVAVPVAVLSTGLGLLSAHVLCRRRPRREFAYLALVSLPCLMPALLSGMALLIYDQQIRLAGTSWAIIVAHTCYCSPFALALIRNPYARLNVELELAARNLGASRLRVFLQIVVPQLWAALASAAALSFLVSWDEFVIAWFVGGFTKTLPTVVYGMLGTSLNPSVNALGTVVVLLSGVLLSLVLWLQGLAAKG
jgi:spermidine/putrescine transport system permease protein